MDVIDRANDLLEQRREDALAAHRARQAVVGTPRTHCVECGDAIAPARLAIVPHTQHCIECATRLEARRRRGPR